LGVRLVHAGIMSEGVLEGSSKNIFAISNMAI
jgi:hypothetical protein